MIKRIVLRIAKVTVVLSMILVISCIGYWFCVVRLPHGNIVTGTAILFVGNGPNGEECPCSIWLATNGTTHCLWSTRQASDCCLELVGASTHGEYALVKLNSNRKIAHYIILNAERHKNIKLPEDDLLGWNPKLSGFVFWNRKSKNFYSLRADGTIVKNISLERFKKILSQPRFKEVSRCEWSEDGTAFITVNKYVNGYKANYWEQSQPTIIRPNGSSYVLNTQIEPLAWSPNAAFIAGRRTSADNRNEVVIINSKTGNERLLWRPPLILPFGVAGAPIIEDIAWDPDDRHVYVIYRRSDIYNESDLAKIDIRNGAIVSILRNSVSDSRIFAF